jgi:hypothetical protein
VFVPKSKPTQAIIIKRSEKVILFINKLCFFFFLQKRMPWHGILTNKTSPSSQKALRNQDSSVLLMEQTNSAKEANSIMKTIQNEISRAECFLADHELELEAMLLESVSQIIRNKDKLQATPQLNYQNSFQPTVTAKKRERKVVGIDILPAKKKCRNKRCEEPGCEKGSSFNYEGMSGFRFCSSHKLDGMINIRTKKKLCEIFGCTNDPHYCFHSAPRHRFCSAHKKDHMILIRSADINHKMASKKSESDLCLSSSDLNLNAKYGLCAGVNTLQQGLLSDMFSGHKLDNHDMSNANTKQ